jgi:Lon protease-like protein
MFPLGTVAVPGSVVPLHVFEPRYRALMIELSDGRIDPPEFGIVLIERGSEVGGGDVRAAVGTAVEPVDLEQLPDGRWFVLARASRRVRVLNWLTDQPYPHALVEDHPDDSDGPVDPGRLEDGARLVRQALGLAVELGLMNGDVAIQLPDEPHAAVWRLCALAPLGPFDRQSLLEVAGPVERLERLVTLTREACDLLTFRLKEG